MLTHTHTQLIPNSYFILLKEAAKVVGDDLFEKLKWQKLEDLLDYEQPTKYIVKTTNYDKKYSLPVLTAGQTFILGYTDENTGVYRANLEEPVIIFDDFTTGNHWVDFDFKVKSSAMKILKAKGETNIRYCYHYMQTIDVDITEHRRQWISIYSKIKILLPSIPVQKHIVNMLDKFEELINDISEGLPREIELRQKQYEYYREKLLSFSQKDL